MGPAAILLLRHWPARFLPPRKLAKSVSRTITSLAPETILTMEPALCPISAILVTVVELSDPGNYACPLGCPITSKHYKSISLTNILLYSYCDSDGCAPGGCVCLQVKMLTALRDYINQFYNTHRRPLEVITLIIQVFLFYDSF
jgi:hypothetical protein